MNKRKINMKNEIKKLIILSPNEAIDDFGKVYKIANEVMMEKDDEITYHISGMSFRGCKINEQVDFVIEEDLSRASMRLINKNI